MDAPCSTSAKVGDKASATCCKLTLSLASSSSLSKHSFWMLSCRWSQSRSTLTSARSAARLLASPSTAFKASTPPVAVRSSRSDSSRRSSATPARSSAAWSLCCSACTSRCESRFGRPLRSGPRSGSTSRSDPVSETSSEIAPWRVRPSGSGHAVRTSTSSPRRCGTSPAEGLAVEELDRPAGPVGGGHGAVGKLGRCSGELWRFIPEGCAQAACEAAGGWSPAGEPPAG
mmetsp:Transcript_19919/g.62588  ORF Transcript_19919/g.62588 Transcript_19919/m.62588 type:complete len:230 (+) Transcript_19919:378-1067(+)